MGACAAVFANIAWADTYLLLRFAKLVAVAIFVTGCLGACFAAGRNERARFGHRWAGAGLTGTWLFGVILLVATHRPLAAPWVVAAAVMSFLAQGIAAVVASREEQARPAERAAMIALLLVALALMVWKPG
jgi:hypothetical protein